MSNEWMGLPVIAPLVVAALLGSAPQLDRYQSADEQASATEQTPKGKPPAPKPSPQKPTPTPAKPPPPAAPQDPPEKSTWLPPSLVFGDTARIDFRVKLHADQRAFSPDLRRLDAFD